MTPTLTTLARRLGFVPVREVQADRRKLTEYELAIDDIAAMQTRYHAPVLRARRAKKNIELGVTRA